jgi:hypothetical protein
MATTMKHCSKCCLEKDVSEFYKSIIGKNGNQLYKSGCIACRKRPEKAWQPKPPKEKKKRVDTRVNRVRDPEKLRINIKKYYEKNRDEILKKQREKTRLKNLFKFSIVEKDEDIPVELL